MEDPPLLDGVQQHGEYSSLDLVGQDKHLLLPTLCFTMK